MACTLPSCLAAQSVVPVRTGLAHSAPQAFVLQIRVVEGEGAVYPPGSRASRALTVEVTDETSKPVEGAAVSFRLPEEGPSGLFANGLRSDVVVTGMDGRASVRGMQWNRTPGPFSISITAAKGQVRAGTVVSLQISGDRVGSASTSRGKWLLVTLLAAGAAGGGVAAGWAVRSRSSRSAEESLSVGTPTISIGKP